MHYITTLQTCKQNKMSKSELIVVDWVDTGLSSLTAFRRDGTILARVTLYVANDNPPALKDQNKVLEKVRNTAELFKEGTITQEEYEIRIEAACLWLNYQSSHALARDRYWYVSGSLAFLRHKMKLLKKDLSNEQRRPRREKDAIVDRIKKDLAETENLHDKASAEIGEARRAVVYYQIKDCKQKAILKSFHNW